MNENLYAILKSRFDPHRDQPCLVAADGAATTYGELDDWTARVAATLADYGVEPGDRVVVQVDKSPASIALYLGTLRAGAVFVPLNTAYTTAEVAYFLNDARPTLFICRPEALATLRDAATHAGVNRITTLGADATGEFAEQVQKATPVSGIADAARNDLASLIYTSGTTGRSKGAMLSHGNLSSNALTLHQLWGWQAGDVLLHALPVFHVHGLFVALNTALLNASPLLFLPQFDADQVRRLLPEATVMMGVPTFYTRLLASSEFGRADCMNMRLFISGSAPLSAATSEQFRERSGHRILERYGMTEAGMITSNPLDGDRVPGTVGHALPGVDVRVCDEAGEPVAPGTIGTVEVRGPNVFRGYWGMPEKTAAEMRADGFFITGDLGQLDTDGRLTIVGRGKDLIISGGYNVYPKEVELCLDGIDGIVESAVIGVPHPDFGEAVIAILVRDNKGPDEATIARALDTQLARFKHPKKYIDRDALPRNAMGKVQKNVLRKELAAIFQNA